MGKKMDTVYVASKSWNQLMISRRKKIRDSRFPVIMRDMLLQVVGKMPPMVPNIYIIGYSIKGKRDCTFDHGMLLDILLC